MNSAITSEGIVPLNDTLLMFLTHQKHHKRMQQVIGSAIKTNKDKVLSTVETLSLADNDKNYLKRQVERLSRRVR